MRRLPVKTMALLVCLCLAGIAAAVESSQRDLLLVCGTESTIPQLSREEVRKLFLGVPIVKDGIRLKPLRNASDELITEVFLQKTVFMSKRSYERQLLSRVFRLGGSRPPVYTDITELTAELRRSPESVTYMWSDQVTQANAVKSIGVLWASTNN